MRIAALRCYGVNHSAAIVLLAAIINGSIKDVELYTLKGLLDAVAATSGKICRVVKAIFFVRVVKFNISHFALRWLFIEHNE